MCLSLRIENTKTDTMKQIFYLAVFLMMATSCATTYQETDTDFVFDSDKPGWMEGNSHLLDISVELDELVSEKTVTANTVARYDKYLNCRRYFDAMDTLPPRAKCNEAMVTADDADFARLINPYPATQRKILLIARNAGIDVLSHQPAKKDTLPDFSSDFIYFIEQ